MRAVVQRVSEAKVVVEGSIAGQIGTGLLVLLGISHDDTRDDVIWLADKIRQMRIFQDADDKMNLALDDISGDILVVSQFTLHASTKKGNRPSFILAAQPEIAIPLYEQFIRYLREQTGKEIPSGIFGADMKVHLINDGPVTIIIDSKNKE
jgi:D-tyrosyl-tRNA(Tyr) deacylase